MKMYAVTYLFIQKGIRSYKYEFYVWIESYEELRTNFTSVGRLIAKVSSYYMYSDALLRKLIAQVPDNKKKL